MVYSIDLRNRVLKFIENGGGITEAAKIFCVTRITIYNWCRLKRKTGKLVDPPPVRKPWKKINSKLLLERIEKYPDAKQSDHASFFKVSNVAISKAFKRLKITRKKNAYFIKKEKIKNVKILEIK